jgi:hypothetical protein
MHCKNAALQLWVGTWKSATTAIIKGYVITVAETGIALNVSLQSRRFGSKTG